MSDFEDAKLILMPNAGKAGKAYCVKPFDGSGDLTVVRNTTATTRNSSGNLESVAVNVPRLNHPVGGGCPSWLIEPQATNIVIYSEDFSQHNISGGSIISNNILSPNGSVNGDTFVENTDDSQHRIREDISVSAGTYTFSVFVKGTDRFISLYPQDAGDAYALFDVSNETITKTGGADYVNSSIENYGNGWYRCILNYNVNAGTSKLHIYLSNTSTNPAPTYIGNSSEMSFYGAQLEQGGLTSYIPTNGTAVTRNADVFQPLNVQSLFNSNEGSIYFELKNCISVDSTNKILGLDDGSGGVSNFFGLYVWSATAGTVAIRNRQGNIDLTITIIPNPENAKIAIKFGSFGLKTFLNGVEFQSSAVAYSGFVKDLVFNPFNGLIELKSLVLFPTAKSDAELINLTTI
jgi:hypothetical protein